jgi:hypothetical protein
LSDDGDGDDGNDFFDEPIKAPITKKAAPKGKGEGKDKAVSLTAM